MKSDLSLKIKISFILTVILAVFDYGLRIDRGEFSPLAISHLEQKIGEQYSRQNMPAENKTEPAETPILVYHSVLPYYPGESAFKKDYDVEPAMFEQQMLYLIDNGYQAVSLDDLAEHLINGLPMPKKSFVMTFDDGWQNQYTYALPILKKYNLTATFFIYTNPVGRSPIFMNWNEIKDLDSSGMTIGDHTESHLYLSPDLDDKTLRKEIIESKKIIESHLNKEIYFFAYPFYHDTPEAAAIVKEAGFKAARAGYSSDKNNLNNIFTLRSIQAPANMKDFIKKINL